MTEPQTITVEHLQALLDTPDATSMIGLIEGKVEIIGAAQRDSGKYRGALEVISRGDLAERVGDEAGKDDLRSLAAALTTSITHLGG
jgi:hypothetical protein